ncbi:hypothetical protein [Kitasatospora sp. CB01950]|uniref:hypothetical protein n=1 Tax=Kitasatospora sp. CB01950 TaxID=1703930 RepID=UPI00093E3A28|nr:hypothetical protein [Kitasatospora sp. CB01950]OKI95053.1 hypothetical protein AMK19_32780 [Kitasatospora sp. CB01950]
MFLSLLTGMLVCMNDREQQDDGEAQDGEQAVTKESGPGRVRIVRPFPLDYDPLGPLRAQLADLGRIVNQPLFNTLASIRAEQNAQLAASVAAAAGVKTSIIGSGLVSSIVGASRASEILRDSIAIATAEQRSVLTEALRIVPPSAGSFGNVTGLIGSDLKASFADALQLRFVGADLLSSTLKGGAFSETLRTSVATALAGQRSVVSEALRIVPVTGPSPADLFSNVVGLAGSNFAASYVSPLMGIAEEIRRSLTKDLFAGFDRIRDLFKDWLPDNLADLGEEQWAWLLRVAAKDGACFAWAPRAEIVTALLALPSAAARQQYLVDHRQEVVQDVEASLEEVDHPDLEDLRELTLQAAACLRDGHDAPAQALLGNVLDTLMSAHGKAWLRSYFPAGTLSLDPGTGSHKVIAGVLGAYTDTTQLRRLSAILLITAMKNTFLGKVERQHTFNRHLSAHNASAHSYRSEFAFTALLNTQALLRLVDRYLYAST